VGSFVRGFFIGRRTGDTSALCAPFRLKPSEATGSAMVLAIVADLVPAESFGVARIVGERPHREHGAHGGIETVDGVGVRLAALFKDDARRFNGPEPMQTPADAAMVSICEYSSGVAGSNSVMREPRSSLKRSRDSPSTSMVLARMPCFRALREELRLPPMVLGPVDFFALARFAASRFSESGIRAHYAWGRDGWMAMLLILLRKILVTLKVASAGGARFGCGGTGFGPPVD